ncbi:MAG: D-cysteine desulfhydrase family protein [Gammaproteobacteria bacterium]|jgi:D-cysteine desulfhydrase|nr:D-cysteine desulfhydrase family protein [Gammaproteobacteria bacterium]MBT5202471.1 D-cysteine desulfhydrase family protein [Gammaproteobacteria bacterium]MBT5601895.1 D-cysteine desulfhydrase family protein [Gammaproteobacteria bacterium]MBT6246858.1 D-cysteine desulfhydrase family protein [Gammaproteobacteria bacterium]
MKQKQQIMKTPEKLTLARLPTPLEPLDRLSNKLRGPRIWVKRDDLTESTGSGNKIRKLEYVMADALRTGASVVITSGGIQSNHCRATAFAAAKLGISCHLILRGRPPASLDGNLLLDRLLGATISYATAAEFADLDSLYKRTEKLYSDQGISTYSIPIGASNALGMWGYINAAVELKADFLSHNIQPDHIFSATGSGGTLAGLIVGQQLFQLPGKIAGFNVADDGEFFRTKIAADIDNWGRQFGANLPALPIKIIEGYVGPGYGRAGPEVFSCIDLVAKLEGLILDPVYTGKAFHGMLESIRRGQLKNSSDIVFLHTGGIFGLFPHRASFTGPDSPPV